MVNGGYRHRRRHGFPGGSNGPWRPAGLRLSRGTHARPPGMLSPVVILLASLVALPLATVGETTCADTVQAVVASARRQTAVTVEYDPLYVSLDYPGGDVPRERGVCTDVIVRAFRAAGVDLQQLVHEDMSKGFEAYPQTWGLSGPDPNIDHRRVPNLMRFFERAGASLPVTSEAADYVPGDVVAWKLDNGLDHVGMVVDVSADSAGRYAIVHNIGAGAHLEDVLFEFEITGHYRFFGRTQETREE